MRIFGDKVSQKKLDGEFLTYKKCYLRQNRGMNETLSRVRGLNLLWRGGSQKRASRMASRMTERVVESLWKTEYSPCSSCAGSPV